MGIEGGTLSHDYIQTQKFSTYFIWATAVHAGGAETFTAYFPW